MSKELSKIIDSKENKFMVNGEEVKLTGSIVKNYLTRGNADISDQEVVMFINLCKYQKLNPFLNEAYLVKFKGAPAQNIVGKEAFMKRAEKNEQYDGFKAGIIIERNGEYLEVEGSFMLPDDKLIGGWAEVHRKDRKFPIIAKVGLNEYNKKQSTWNQIPQTMIRKTAIVQALREAFPDNLGGMYVEEEIPEAQVVEPDEKVEKEIKQNANKQEVKFDKTKAVDVEPTKEEEPEQMDLEGTPFEEEGPDF
jgi:phage recombination protein Bet